MGIRAQGMGGAFVAVADDATATWWNPAGLASGAYFSAIIELDTGRHPRGSARVGDTTQPAWRSSVRGLAASFPALGLSYYRQRVSEIRATGPTGTASPGRQDQGPALVLLESGVIDQLGATVGQSLGEHVVVASTLKLVRGSFASATVAAGDGTFDRAEELEGHAETRGDLDVGALIAFGGLRAGISVKHLTQPTFGAPGDRIELRRQARVGVAAMSTPASGPALTLAFDADLTRTPTTVGDQRHIAAGVEAWLHRRQIGLRGGLSGNTVGEAAPVVSLGVSVAVRSGLYFDGAVTAGGDQSRTGWGVAARLTF